MWFFFLYVVIKRKKLEENHMYIKIINTHTSGYCEKNAESARVWVRTSLSGIIWKKKILKNHEK